MSSNLYNCQLRDYIFCVEYGTFLIQGCSIWKFLNRFLNTEIGVILFQFLVGSFSLGPFLRRSRGLFLSSFGSRFSTPCFKETSHFFDGRILKVETLFHNLIFQCSKHRVVNVVHDFICRKECSIFSWSVRRKFP